MNSKIKLVVIAVVFIIVLIGISFAYNTMKDAPITNNNRNANSQNTQSNNGATQENKTTQGNLKKAPEFTVYDVKGNEVKLSDFIGKPIVINIWSVTCTYCIEEMEMFSQAVEEYKDVEFLMITPTLGNESSKKVSKQFVESNGYKFNIYFDDKDEVMYPYNAYGFPTTVFIDKEGNINKTVSGMINERMFKERIEAIQ